MKFFIPDLREQPEAAEERWSRYLRDSGAAADSERVYSVTYLHDGSKFIATVGELRIEYARKRGPRGGYIKDAPLVKHGRPTGTMISAIIDAGNVLYVWTYGPPFGGWANPSMVGTNEIEDIQYFDEPADASTEVEPSPPVT